MVLAQMLRKKWYAEEFRKGREEGIAWERRRKNKQIIAWAIEKGIPLEDLPIKADEYSQGFMIGYKEGIAIGRNQRDKEYIAWAKEKGIPLEDLPIAQD